MKITAGGVVAVVAVVWSVVQGLNYAVNIHFYLQLHRRSSASEHLLESYRGKLTVNNAINAR
jgi:hypothetical protein